MTCPLPSICGPSLVQPPSSERNELLDGDAEDLERLRVGARVGVRPVAWDEIRKARFAVAGRLRVAVENLDSSLRDLQRDQIVRMRVYRLAAVRRELDADDARVAVVEQRRARDARRG